MKADKSIRKIEADPSLALLLRSRSFRWVRQHRGRGHRADPTRPGIQRQGRDQRQCDDTDLAAYEGQRLARPVLLFSLLVGNWVEGRDKQRIMVPADLVRAVLLATIPLAWATGWLSLPWLIAVALLAGVAGIFFEIAGFAYVPDLVATEEVPAANRAVQGSSTVSEVAGPGLAGLLVQALGPPLAIVADAVSYLASALGVLKGRPRPPHRPPRPAMPTTHRPAGGRA